MNKVIATAGATTLVDKEGYAVKLHTDGTVIVCSAATDIPMGVLVAGAAVGSPVSVALPGTIVPVKLSGTVKQYAHGDLAADATFVTAANSTACKCVQFLEAGVSGDLVNALILTPNVA
jgi:hypothetical protein